MAAYIGTILLSLLSVPLLVRHLGVSSFGSYAAVLALVAIVGGGTEGGLNAIALRALATLPEQRRPELMANLLGIRIVVGVAGVIVAVIFAGLAGYSGQLVLGTALAGLGVVFILSQALLTVPLQVELRLGWVSALELLRQFIAVGLIVLLVALGAGVAAFLAVTIPAGIAVLAITAVLLRSQAAVRPAFHLGAWLPLVRDSIPYALAIALNAMYLRITIVVMSIIATGLQTGYFATSFRILETLIGIPVLVIGAAFPILARAVRDDAKRFASATARIFELSVIVGSWMAISIIITAPLAVRLIGGAQDAPAAPVLRIQSLALIATFVTVACAYPLLAERRYREVLLVNAVGLCAGLMLTFALVPSFGAKGGAIATVAAEVVLAAASAGLLARSQRNVRLPWSSLPLVLVAAAAALGSGLAVPVPAVAQAAISTLIYGLALAAVRRFPPELRRIASTWQSTCAS